MKQFDWPRIVAVWQMAGAALSGVTFLEVLPNSGLPADVWQSVLAVLLAICVLAVLAGRALYQRRREGRRLSFLIWALQIPSLAVGQLRYGLTLGPYVYVGLFPNGVAGVSAGFWSHAALRWHAPVPNYSTGGVNVLALVALAVVWFTTRGSRPVGYVAPAA